MKSMIQIVPVLAALASPALAAGPLPILHDQPTKSDATKDKTRLDADLQDDAFQNPGQRAIHPKSGDGAQKDLDALMDSLMTRPMGDVQVIAIEEEQLLVRIADAFPVRPDAPGTELVLRAYLDATVQTLLDPSDGRAPSDADLVYVRSVIDDLRVEMKVHDVASRAVQPDEAAGEMQKSIDALERALRARAASSPQDGAAQDYADRAVQMVQDASHDGVALLDALRALQRAELEQQIGRAARYFSVKGQTDDRMSDLVDAARLQLAVRLAEARGEG